MRRGQTEREGGGPEMHLLLLVRSDDGVRSILSNDAVKSEADGTSKAMSRRRAEAKYTHDAW